MIKIENVVLPSPEQWEAVIRGMRNPKNSWHLSDSYFGFSYQYPDDCEPEYDIEVGPNDHKLMMKLAGGGPVHAKYRRMIDIFVDITAPLYWWKEFDTYKIGTVTNSCSTMHKIHDKEFTLDDFSHEHLFDEVLEGDVTDEIFLWKSGFVDLIINGLNEARRRFLETGDKKYWWQMIQLLPSSYNQKRTVKLNYEVLVGIYIWRKNHKLDEWCAFCEWIETLPYSELITGGKTDEK